MSASKDFSKQIRVVTRYNPACRMFALTSPELPGLILAGPDQAKLLDDVPAVIKAMYRVGCGMQVEVTMDTPPSEPDMSFIPLRPTTLVKVDPLVS